MVLDALAARYNAVVGAFVTILALGRIYDPGVEDAIVHAAAPPTLGDEDPADPISARICRALVAAVVEAGNLPDLPGDLERLCQDFFAAEATILAMRLATVALILAFWVIMIHDWGVQHRGWQPIGPPEASATILELLGLGLLFVVGGPRESVGLYSAFALGQRRFVAAGASLVMFWLLNLFF